MSDMITRVMLATRLDPGVQLNDTYEIDERIASGGMGEVYRGHNIQTGEPVAIKTILPELADQESISALFKKEATTLGRLHHETIVRYYSFSRDPRLGRTYLAMEFVDGTSLADRIRTTPLTPDEVRKLFAKVADGLAIAHGAGVVHRDLSPDNIILRGDRVDRPTIIDFGIARSTNVGDGTLIGGGFAGKFNFVSPEQLGIHSREVDDRSDIYSLGLVIAAALRGDPLDMGGSHVDVIEKRSKLPDLSSIDPEMRPLVEAMLQPNPDDRPAGAAEVSEWLRSTAPQVQPAAAANIGWTGVPGAGPSGMQTGVPFAVAQGEEPTRLVVPTPVPGPPQSSGESPFAATTTPVMAAPAGLPGALAPAAIGSAQAVQRKSSGAARYAVAGGALLLLLAAGGGYMSGLFGPGSENGDGTRPPTEESGTPTTGTDTATTQDEATAETIGNIEDDRTGPTDTGPPTTNGSSNSPNTSGSSGTSGTPDTPETPNTSGTSETTSSGQSTTTGDTVQGTGDTQQSGQTDVQTVGTEGSSTETEGSSTTTGTSGGPEDVKTAAAGVTHMIDVGVSWLRQYDGGRCFFVAVTSVTDKTINVKGFGLNPPAFERLYNSFVQSNGFEPEMNGHLVNEAQCAVTDFLKAVQPAAKDNPQLTLASDSLISGDPLVATVDKAGGKVLDLLFVDSDGFVYNMRSFAQQTAKDGKAIFEMLLKSQKPGKNQPQMIIALTSPTGLDVPPGKEKVNATDLFPKLTSQIKGMNGDVGLDFAYFELSL